MNNSFPKISCCFFEPQPSIKPVSGCFQFQKGWITIHSNLPMTNTLESLIRHIVLRPMFDNDMRLQTQFIRNEKGLQRSFWMYGIFHLCILPFSLIFAVVFSIVSLFEEAKRSQNYLGSRIWSPHAHWLFRKYNELPHSLVQRCSTAIPKAEFYLKQFPSPLFEVIGRFITFVSGSFLVILLFIALFVDEQMLTDMHFGSKNLLWYVAVFSAIMATGRSMTPAPDEIAISPRQAMSRLVKSIQYKPMYWNENEHTNDVKNSILLMFPNRATLALRELVAIILTPYILCVVMPQRVHTILHTIRTNTLSIQPIGDVCIHPHQPN